MVVHEPGQGPLMHWNAFEGGALNESLIIDIGDTQLEVANNLVPTYMLGTAVNLQFLITELYNDLHRLDTIADQASSCDLDAEQSVLLEDSDDEDPEAQHYITLVENAKKSRDSSCVMLAYLLSHTYWHVTGIDAHDRLCMLSVFALPSRTTKQQRPCPSLPVSAR